MTRKEIVAALEGVVPNPIATRLRDGKWMISWGRGEPKKGVMVEDEGLTAERVRALVGGQQ